MQRLVASII